MTKREAEKMLKSQLGDELSDYTIKGDLAGRLAEQDRLLVGFFVNRSQMHSQLFDLVAFVQPLFVPSAGIALGLSRPVGSYRSDSTASLREMTKRVSSGKGCDVLSRYGSLPSLADPSTEVDNAKLDQTLHREVIACSRIYLGDAIGAEQQMAELLSTASSRSRGSGFRQRVYGRVAEVQVALLSSISAAIALLDDRRDSSIERMGLSYLKGSESPNGGKGRRKPSTTASSRWPESSEPTRSSRPRD